MKKNFVLMATMIAVTTSCRAPIKDNPIDEMANFSRAENAFALAVQSVTAAGRAGEITRVQGRRIEPLVDEGNDLLQDAYDVISQTPIDQDPVFEPDLVNRLFRIAIKISAQLAIEKERNDNPTEES